MRRGLVATVVALVGLALGGAISGWPDRMSGDVTIPVDTMPVDSIPVDSVPVDSMPVDTMPVDTIPVDGSAVVVTASVVTGSNEPAIAPVGAQPPTSATP